MILYESGDELVTIPRLHNGFMPKQNLVGFLFTNTCVHVSLGRLAVRLLEELEPKGKGEAISALQLAQTGL